MKLKEITERQKQIIEASAKILITTGISGLTIKNLAKEMNFSESAIYRHFINKEEIILTLLNFVFNNMNKNFSKIKDNLNSIEKLKIVFEDYFNFFNSNPHLVVAIFSDIFLEESKEINEQIFNIMSVRKKNLESIILQGQKENLFTKEISSEDIAHIIMGSVRLEMYKWRINKFEYDIVSSGNKIINNLILLVGKKL